MLGVGGITQGSTIKIKYHLEYKKVLEMKTKFPKTIDYSAQINPKYDALYRCYFMDKQQFMFGSWVTEKFISFKKNHPPLGDA